MCCAPVSSYPDCCSLYEPRDDRDVQMTTWKRWSWRYRIGALFALTLLLQGASCPQITKILPRYQVPGIGSVVPERSYDANVGKYYYRVEYKHVVNGMTYYTHGWYYEGSWQYQTIDNYFRAHPDLPVLGLDRYATPGGASALPPPAVQ